MYTNKKLVVALLATTLLSVPAFAQDKNNTSKAPSWARVQHAPTVVVTPTKSSRDINEIPYAVSVVKRDTKMERQPSSFDDAFKMVPNFDSAGGNRTVTEEPSLRGLSDRRLVIKVDGIRRAFRAQYGGRYFLDPQLVDRMEVVRGSNSAIDGTGAIAGTIQLFTASALDELRGASKNYGFQMGTGFQTGNDQLSAMFSGYTVQGPVDLYFGGSHSVTDDYRSGNGVVPNSSGEPTNSILKAGYTFAPGSRLELRVARYFDNSMIPASPFQPTNAVTNPVTQRQSGVTDYSLGYNLKPNGNKYIDLHTLFYRSEYKITSERQNIIRVDQTNFSTNGLDVYNTATLNGWGLEHKLTTGVEYFEDKQNGTRNGAVRTTLGSGADQNLGLYAQTESTLWDRLTIIPGLRFDRYELNPRNATLPSQTREHWSPKLGANLKLDDAWSIYGSIAGAFRTPTLTELYSEGVSPGVTIVANPNLLPETALNKEVGLRFAKGGVITQNDSLGFKMAAFENKIQDYIEQVVTAGPTASFRNVSDARLRGIEIEGNYRINNYNFIAAAGGVRGENETTGANLSDVPGDKYSLAAEHYMMGNQFKSGLRANLMMGQDRIPTGQPDIVTTPTAMTYDVYTSWTPDATKDGSFRIDAGVDNMFDKNYRRQLAFIPEMGRNAKVSLNWKF